MVGGLADWFAVTALFRTRCGCPIPHTAIIPRKKDQIGAGLAGFVQEYFLTTEIVGERVAAAQVPQRVGDLAGRTRARRAGSPQELSNAISGARRRAAGQRAARRGRDLRRQAAARARRGAAARPRARRGVRLGTAPEGAHDHAQGTDEVPRREPRRPSASGWPRSRRNGCPTGSTTACSTRAFTALQSFLADVTLDSEHDLRSAFDTQLRALAERLRTDPEQIAKVERAKLELLDHPQVREWLSTLWLRGKALVVDGCGRPGLGSAPRCRAPRRARRRGAARRLADVAARVEQALQRVAEHVVTHYGADLTAVISSTIERWDTEETSRAPRVAGRARPAVHPDQRHGGRLAGRPARSTRSAASSEAQSSG